MIIHRDLCDRNSSSSAKSSWIFSAVWLSHTNNALLYWNKMSTTKISFVPFLFFRSLFHFYVSVYFMTNLTMRGKVKRGIYLFDKVWTLFSSCVNSISKSECTCTHKPFSKFYDRPLFLFQHLFGDRSPSVSVHTSIRTHIKNVLLMRVAWGIRIFCWDVCTRWRFVLHPLIKTKERQRNWFER